MQNIDTQHIDSKKLNEIIKKLNFTTNASFAEYLTINKSSLSDWINERVQIPKNFKIALFYIDECIKLNETIKELKEQIKSANNIELNKQVNELSKKMNQLQKQFENHKTSLK